MHSFLFVVLSLALFLSDGLCFAAAGDVDAGFATGGKVLAPTGNVMFNGDFDEGTTVWLADGARALVRQSDGRLVAAGGFMVGGGDSQFGVARYNADGTPDATFGGGTGYVTTTFSALYAVANAVVVQPDGKVVAAGHANLSGDPSFGHEFALVRYLSDGTLDASFGAGGVVLTTIHAHNEGARALILQPDGKLVAGGTTRTDGGSDDFALIRYNDDGTLDPSFGIGGIVETKMRNFPGNIGDQVRALALQPDGAIVAAGYSYNSVMGNGTDTDVALARYDATGTLDPSFGTGGIVITNILTGPGGSTYDQARALTFQSDGKLVVVCSWVGGGNPAHTAVVRYNIDGTPDSTFGDGDGISKPLVGATDVPHAVVVQPDAKIVVAGESGFDNPLFLTLRFRSNGELDPTFGTNGIATTRVRTGTDGPMEVARAVLLQPDGKLVVAGTAANVGGSSYSSFGLVRYLGDDCAGTPDTDGDGVCDALDDCPSVSNLSQADADGDGHGDACDPCNGSPIVFKPILTISKLGSPGAEKLQMKGSLLFPGALPLAPLDVSAKGMHIQIVDLGAGEHVVIDHVIPAGLAPTACGPKDGWKANATLTSHKYGNKTNAIQPGCVAGSALGIYQAQAQDKTAKSKGVNFKIAGKNGTYGPVVGPFRMTVVLGGAPEGTAGQCGQIDLTGRCAVGATSAKCK